MRTKRRPPKGEESPRRSKSPRLGLQALASAALEASDLMEEGAEGTGDSSGRCEHWLPDSAREALRSLLLSMGAGTCVGCWLEDSCRLQDKKLPVKQRPEKSSVLVCLQCDQRFCSGVGGIAYPFGHSRAHAFKDQHWVAALCGGATRGYCFKCNTEVELPVELDPASDARPRQEGTGANKGCDHVPADRVHGKILRPPLGKCDYCGRMEGTSKILVCLGCSWEFCAEHALGHAKQKQHWFAVLFKSPEVGFCFKCEAELDVHSGEIWAGGRASGFGSVVPGVMGDARLRARKADESSRDATVLAAPLVMDDLLDREEWLEPDRRCNHLPSESAYKAILISLLLSGEGGTECEGCKSDDLPVGSRLLMCLECGRRSCGDLVCLVPRGHARDHAKQEQHWLATQSNDLQTVFCYKCEINALMWSDSDSEEEEEMLDRIESRGDAFGSDVAPLPVALSVLPSLGDTSYDKEFGLANVQGYAIKGIPNRGSTCYMSAMVQCLLVLDKLRARMLGPDPPLGDLGRALKELFVEASTAHAVGGTLDPDKLLTSVRFHAAEFQAHRMHDSHELLDSLRDALHNEGNGIETPYRQNGAPTVIDLVFSGVLSLKRSCICCQSVSVVYEPFCELSLALPSKDLTSRSDASPQTSKNFRSQTKKAAAQLFVENESSSVKIEAVAKSIDSYLGSELKDVEPEPLEVGEFFCAPAPFKNSAEAQHIFQSKDVIHNPLQILTWSELQELFIEVPLKSVSPVPCKMSDVKVEQTIGTTTDSHCPEDIGPHPLGASLRANDSQKAAGNYVGQHNNGDSGDVLNRPEVSIEDKGNSVPSIEDCLSLFFEEDTVERSCGCSMVAEQPSTNQSENSNIMMASTNDETAVEVDQTEQSDMTISPNEQPNELNSLSVEYKLSSSREQDSSDADSEIIQTADINTDTTDVKMSCDEEHECHDGIQEAVSSCLPAEKQTNQLSGQHSQIFSTPNHQHASQRPQISKLPPVLTLHLKRYIQDGKRLHKNEAYVSYKEYLDVGRFMDSSSMDQGNTIYHLAGVVEHRGPTMNSGHYVAYVRARRLGDEPQQSGRSSSWFCADDETITQVNLEEVLKREAYVLFYERMEG
ncbi:hypothetical protein U9M48_040931 [Paspalum notatum var. saurae]|uniref:Ubiquitinyl hydrolase 1 n=1 Tax=Paspalum notatum var. saurae TaxID=547442 RepID=A0AAQ3UMX4_PASNO